MAKDVFNSHVEMVAALKKPGFAIKANMTAEKADLAHMAIGISGEAGEILDAIKKHVIHGKPLDMDNLKEELGDLEFFLEGLRQSLCISREETLAGNLLKLSKRYPSGGYSDADAIARADKQDGQ